MLQRLKLLGLIGLVIMALVSCASEGGDSDKNSAANALDEETGGNDADFADNKPPSAGAKATNDDDFGDDNGKQETADFEEGKADDLDADFGDEPKKEQPKDDALSKQANALKDEPVQEPAPAPEATPPPPAIEATTRAQAVTITNINFVANQNGGTVIIEASDRPTIKTRMNPNNNQMIVEIANATLPARWKRPFLMNEFEGASFAAINAYQNAGSTTARIVVQLKSSLEPVVQQEGNQILVIPASGAFGGPVAKTESTENQKAVEPEVTLKPESGGESDAFSAAGGEKTDAETVFGDAEKWSYDTGRVKLDQKGNSIKTLEDFLTGQTRFYGRKISIETAKDADVRDVINFISEQSGLNIVLSEKVGGKIQLRLRQVPWDQALYIVMKVQSLGYIREGSVLRIAPITDLKKEASEAKEYLNTQKTLSPMRVKVIPISFANVKEITTQITSFLSPSRRGEASVTADERTASVIVTDTAESLDKIERLVKELDTPPTQVLIEGKIVEASDTFQSSIGVNIRQLSFQTTTGVDFNTALRSDGGVAGASGLTTSLNVSGFNLDSFLDLSEANGQVRIVSSPRIVTVNNKQALMEQTGQVFLPSTRRDSTGNETSSLTPTPVVLKLQVTPQITSDGSVIMDVDVQRDFPGPSVTVNGTIGTPVNSRHAKTTVMVKTGETAVIGGVFQKDETLSVQGTTGLMEIPILGWLFKGKNKGENKNELLVFLTPRVLNIQDQGVKATSNKQPGQSKFIQ